MAVRKYLLQKANIKIDSNEPDIDPIITVQDIKEKMQLSLDDEALEAINQDLDNLYRNITDRNIRGPISTEKLRRQLIKDVSITTTETVVSHNIGKIPVFYNILCRGNAVGYESREADASFLYIKGSGSITVDIMVEG